MKRKTEVIVKKGRGNMFGKNMKALRKHKKYSQEVLASELQLTRSTLSAYETGNAEPGISVLLRIADFFKISLDRILRQDISCLTTFELRKIEEGYDLDLRGRHLRILATTVDDDNNEQIELVHDEAKAGYTAGYADPEYISELPRLKLPFLTGERKYRVFPITGDSMPPVNRGSFVVGRYVEDWTTLKNGTPCIVVTSNDGIVFKNVHNLISTEYCLELHSNNPEYDPYKVSVHEILEVWYFEYYISNNPGIKNVTVDQINQKLDVLMQDLKELRRK